MVLGDIPEGAEPVRFTPADGPPARPVEYRPCPDCDGWLVHQATEFQAADDGPVAVAERWVCFTCGTVERDPPDRGAG